MADDARIHEAHSAVAGVDAGFEYAWRVGGVQRNRHRYENEG
jgi:hypothetical protein